MSDLYHPPFSITPAVLRLVAEICEFIHPFPDGNGRLGRLWQTLILNKWNALFAALPIETIIHAHQETYYEALAQSDNQGNATGFVEFMLRVIQQTIVDAIKTDQVTDQVMRLLKKLNQGPLSASKLMEELNLAHRPTFRKNYLQPALDAALIEMTQPDTPRSPTQRYRLTEKGIELLLKQKSESK